MFQKEDQKMRLLKQTQASSFATISEYVFAPTETTREGNQYLLPTLREPSFPFQTVSYQSAKEKLLKRQDKITILDIGCGAGFWLENECLDPRVIGIGITAEDYRLPSQRPPVVFQGYQRNYDGRQVPVHTNPNGWTTYIGSDLSKTGQLKHEQYLIGDVYDLLREISTDSIDLVVSYQACRYFFDPLRLLKQTNRVLKPNGYAFLESFNAQVINRISSQSDLRTLTKVLKTSGMVFALGEYYPDEHNTMFGLSFKKTKPHLKLPVTYNDTVFVEKDHVAKANYREI